MLLLNFSARKATVCKRHRGWRVHLDFCASALKTDFPGLCRAGRRTTNVTAAEIAKNPPVKGRLVQHTSCGLSIVILLAADVERHLSEEILTIDCKAPENLLQREHHRNLSASEGSSAHPKLECGPHRRGARDQPVGHNRKFMI